MISDAVATFRKTISDLTLLVANPTITSRELDEAKERLRLAIDLLGASALTSGLSQPATDILEMSWRLTQDDRETKKLAFLQQIADSGAQAASGVTDDL